MVFSQNKCRICPNLTPVPYTYGGGSSGGNSGGARSSDRSSSAGSSDRSSDAGSIVAGVKVVVNQVRGWTPVVDQETGVQVVGHC